ncbi:Alpha/Beta hydrolase protein [Melanogaster broomeanus]|nr:Alpha/Beta hydrolase protein [Melanogaster broomeanus]
MLGFKFALLLSSLSGFLLSEHALASTTGDTVNVGYATYQGNRSYPNTVAYLGIPYVEPPLGDLRFRAPVPLNTTRVSEVADGRVINATYYPDSCVQGSMGEGDAGGAGSEDCLKLNIYAPYGAVEGDDLPVLFYIHGGGYVWGNPGTLPFDRWIHQSPNVVIVSVYYRLGTFGFLATPEFTDPTYGDFNVGFKDQIEALKWVKQHIRAFGGDPNRVTINGQSAGGTSVELHMLAQEEERLFHRAMAQSVYRTPLPTPEQQLPLFDFFVSYAGCGTALSICEQMACLRNASVSALARAQDGAAQGKFSGLYNAFHPVVDGALFTGYPTLQFQSGEFTHVPSLSGSNISLTLKEFFPSLTETDIEEFVAQYPLSDYDSPSQQFQVATGEPEVICGREAMGGASSLFSDTWTYRYNTPNPTLGSDEVTHGADVWMMFEGSNFGFNGTATFSRQTPAELAFASELIAYWLSFVRCGNPNTYKLDMSPTWENTLHPQNSTTVSGCHMEKSPTAEENRCAFVISKAEHTED